MMPTLLASLSAILYQQDRLGHHPIPGLRVFRRAYPTIAQAL